MKHLLGLVIALSLIFGAQGCASIVSKSNYPVTINSAPDDAAIVITNHTGQEIYRGRTPTTLTLSSCAGYFSGASYNISFEKDGYESRVVSLQKELDGWYIGNILIGGLIGFLIVDPATGAMWKLPPNVTASLEKKVSAFSMDGKQVKVAMLSDVPHDLIPLLQPVQ